ncbi:unnamed protein product, partial [Ectocarpus fasciculatus]
HKLQNTWVFWEHKQCQTNADWNNAMREVCEFGTVEDFWKYFSYVPRPSEIFNDGSNSGKKEVNGKTIEAFSIFKKGIRPEWEDPVNRTGSELVCRKTMHLDLVDVYWENLVLAMIGEAMDEDDDICGGRIVDKSKKGSSRTMFKIEIWMRTASAETGERIRLKLLDALTDNEASKPGFTSKQL